MKTGLYIDRNDNLMIFDYRKKVSWTTYWSEFHGHWITRSGFPIGSWKLIEAL